jgi:hypothetical protein
VGEVVFVFGPTRRVSVSDEDARYLAESWFKSWGGQAGIKLTGATRTALQTGEEIRLTEGMRQELLAVLDKVEEDGRLGTGGLLELHDEARVPIVLPPE